MPPKNYAKKNELAKYTKNKQCISGMELKIIEQTSQIRKLEERIRWCRYYWKREGINPNSCLQWESNWDLYRNKRTDVQSLKSKDLDVHFAWYRFCSSGYQEDALPSFETMCLLKKWVNLVWRWCSCQTCLVYWWTATNICT